MFLTYLSSNFDLKDSFYISFYLKTVRKMMTFDQSLLSGHVSLYLENKICGQHFTFCHIIAIWKLRCKYSY